MVARGVGKQAMFIRVMWAVIFMFAAATAFAQEREWTFDTNDEDAFLTFGVPETDDVGVSFWCKMQSGEARVFLPEAGEGLTPGRNVKVTFSVAGAKFTFGTNNASALDLGRCEYGLQLVEECRLVWQDFFVPLKAPKAVERKGEALRA